MIFKFLFQKYFAQRGRISAKEVINHLSREKYILNYSHEPTHYSKYFNCRYTWESFFPVHFIHDLDISKLKTKMCALLHSAVANICPMERIIRPIECNRWSTSTNRHRGFSHLSRNLAPCAGINTAPDRYCGRGEWQTKRNHVSQDGTCLGNHVDSRRAKRPWFKN